MSVVKKTIFSSHIKYQRMNNKEFIDAYSKELGCSASEASVCVERIVSVLTRELQEGNPVCVQEFGTFEVKKKMERVSVIPSTRQRVLVPPKLVLGFKPSVGLKERLK